VPVFIQMLEQAASGNFMQSVGVAVVILALSVYFAAGAVKGTIGIGFPTTAISLLAQFTDARTAIGLAIIPMVVTNAWQVYRSRRIYWVLSQFWVLWLTMILGIAAFKLLV